MKSPRFHLCHFAPLAVALSGFAGGLIFLAALQNNNTQPGTLAVAGITGAFAYLGFWLILSSIAAPNLSLKTGAFLQRSGAWFAIALLPLVLYLPYLVYRSGATQESAELPPLASPATAIILLAWSLLLLAALLRLNFKTGPDRTAVWIEKHARFLLIVMIVIWVAVFFPLDVLKNHFMHVTTVNSALFIEGLLNLNDERGFMFSNLLYGNGSSVLAVHANFILLLFAAPVYFWPDYRLLLLVSDIALALGAIPLYLIGRRYFSAAVSLLLAAMYLFHPILTAQPGRSDFSEIRFVPLLFLFAFYFFERKRFWAFALAAFLLMTIREDMGLFVAFFGIYSLWHRRSPRWVLAPIAAGLIWFFVMYKLLLPGLSPTGTSARAAIRYGASFSELIIRPISTPSHIGVLYGLFTTFGLGLPLLSPVIILALPVLAEILLQKHTTLVNFMTLPAVPILMVSLIFGMNNFARFLSRRWLLSFNKSTACMAIIVFFISASAFHTWFNPGLYAPRYNYEAAISALELIPDDSSVVLPEFAFAHARHEQTVRGYHQIEYQKEIEGDFILDEDYVLLDQRWPVSLRSIRYYNGLRLASERLATSSEYRLIFEDCDLQLYQNVRASPD